jgi:hypothetical protein
MIYRRRRRRQVFLSSLSVGTRVGRELDGWATEDMVLVLQNRNGPMGHGPDQAGLEWAVFFFFFYLF